MEDEIGEEGSATEAIGNGGGWSVWIDSNWVADSSLWSDNLDFCNLFEPFLPKVVVVGFRLDGSVEAEALESATAAPSTGSWDWSISNCGLLEAGLFLEFELDLPWVSTREGVAEDVLKEVEGWKRRGEEIGDCCVSSLWEMLAPSIALDDSRGWFKG